MPWSAARKATGATPARRAGSPTTGANEGPPMNDRIVTVDSSSWSEPLQGLVPALEAGKVLFFPRLRFTLSPDEARLLRPDVRDEKSRNISLRLDGVLAGAAVQGEEAALLAAMIGRFR